MKFIVTLLFTIAIYTTYSRNSHPYSYKKISFAIGGCNSVKNCPFITSEIDSNLTYKQYCFQNCDSTGYFLGSISKSTSKKINIILDKINLKNIELEYEFYRDDEYIEMKINKRDKSFTIVGHYYQFPKKVKELIDLMKNIQKTVELTRETDINKINFDIPIPMNNYYLLPIPDKE